MIVAWSCGQFLLSVEHSPYKPTTDRYRPSMHTKQQRLFHSYTIPHTITHQTRTHKSSAVHGISRDPRKNAVTAALHTCQISYLRYTQQTFLKQLNDRTLLSPGSKRGVCGYLHRSGALLFPEFPRALSWSAAEEETQGQTCY